MKESEKTQNSKFKNTFKDVRVYFREYCNSTSVHGFRYFGEKDRATVEKIWWFIVFCICLSACVLSIYEVYKKWEQSPVIVSLANRGTPVNAIPFPAVTICPESKIAGEDKFNYSNILWKRENQIPLTQQEKDSLEYMSLLCEYDRGADYEGNFTLSDEFLDFIDKVKPEILLRNCGFSFTEESDCTKLFTPLITDEGICYSFNILDRSEIFRESVIHYQDFHKSDNATNWSLEGGYTSDAGYPRRTFSAAVSKGLSLNIFLPDDDLDLACISPVRGYKILVHAPTDIPLLGEEYIRVPLSQSVVVAIQPYMITTSSSIKKYSPKKRGCYFQEERYLKYFQTYTAESCKLECLTNFTLEFCGCVHFFMPRENDTKICGSANITCMEKVDSTSAVYTDEDCDCLPRCSDLNYEVSMSASEINYVYAARKASRFNNTYYMTSLTFYFQSDDFITSQRNEFYGPTDFLANFGGLVGLFTGFSVLSFIEILYFLSVRIFFNRRLYGKWSGEQN